MKIGHLAAAALVVLAAVGPAAAHRQTPLDPDDSAGPLDIAAVRHHHRKMFIADSHGGRPTRTDHQLRFKVVMYEGWDSAILRGEYNFVVIELVREDHDQSFRGDLCFYIEPNEDGELRGQMYETCWPSPDDPRGRNHRVARPDLHSLAVKFDRNWLMGRDVTRYEWRVGSSYEEEGHDDCSPGTPPPEKVYGECVDLTRWRAQRL